MLRLFRNQNPYTAILLFVLALLIKMPYNGAHALPPIEQHQVLWGMMVAKLQSIFGTGNYVYSFFAVANITLQALYLNYIVNNFHFYNKRTYLPAYTYIVVTSLLPQWSNFSIEMFDNWLFLLMLNLIFQTYSDHNTRKILFNIGFIFGILVIFNLPNVWFFFFVGLSIAILRAYKPAEWMVTLLGMLTPFYLLVGIAYLTDNLFLFSKIFSSNFSLKFNLPKPELLALGVVLLLCIIGIFVLSQQMKRMLFQIKKMWGVNFLFLVFSLLSTIGILQQGPEIWMVSLIPVSMLIGKIWLISKPKWFPEMLNLLLLFSVVYINFFLRP